MSYCRWSSMNWMCDVYCYEDIYDSFVTHVAGRRKIIPPIPDIRAPRRLVEWMDMEWDKETNKPTYPTKTKQIIATITFTLLAWWNHYIHMGSLNLIPYKNINLQYDGECFYDQTAGDCANRLEWLSSEGYNVPQYAIDCLREEEENRHE